MGQEYGADNVTYCMELDFSERTFSADNLPDGRNSYGWMDFSTMNRVYHYVIDSVSYIGKNQYRVVSERIHILLKPTIHRYYPVSLF